MEKKFRAKYFSFKELRLSIAHMVLWSLLTIAFSTYLFIEIGNRIGQSPLYFIVIIGIYVAIVVILTLLFTHRLLGPFERLKTQLRIIRSGDHDKRLAVRNHDDIYIRSFIEEVNRVIDTLEKSHSFKEDFRERMNSELASIKALSEQDGVSVEKLKKEMASMHARIHRMFRNERSSR